MGLGRRDVAGASAKRGLTPEIVGDISRLKNEPKWMLDLRLKGHRLFGRKPLPTWGAELGDIDFDNIKYFVRSTEKQATSWDDLPADIKNTYDRLGIPEAEKGTAGRWRGGSVRVRGGLPQDQRGARAPGRDLPRHRHRAQGARGPLQGVLRYRHPGRGQQVRLPQHRRLVRRLVHLRAEGRPRGDPAAGLLPDQHREHGPVRADLDHRRRGRLRALRRGLHGADLLL